MKKKKGYQINRSAGKLLENIKEKLINIGKKSKNSKRGKCLSDDRLKLDEMQNFKKFVNDNFYGGEKLKSPKFTVNDYKDDKKENFINMNHSQHIIYLFNILFDTFIKRIIFTIILIKI